jgi:hypothetical protein
MTRCLASECSDWRDDDDWIRDDKDVALRLSEAGVRRRRDSLVVGE